MSSLALRGKGVSKGVAIGKAYLLQRNQLKVREYKIPPSLIENEVERFKEAVEIAKEQLAAILGRIPPATPADIVSFIDTHLLMMSDRALSSEPINLIRQRSCNAEWALKLQRDAVVAVFEEMDDAYLRTRKDDVDYVVSRVQRILLNQDEVADGVGDGDLEGCILIADDLAPADTVTMKHEGIAGFVTEFGGPTSHTAILARSLGIPAVVGVGNVMRYLEQGESVVVDGDSGHILAGASGVCSEYYNKRRVAFLSRQIDLCKLNDRPAVTQDGVAISLKANIELVEDLHLMHTVDAKGVGLYRTEFLFLGRDALPNEDEQYAEYCKVARQINNLPLTIRTLDLGMDKPLPAHHWMSGAEASTNTALGLRAIRLCLRDKTLFIPQLRAILRASATHPVSILIPMLASVEEIEQVKAIVEQLKTELAAENIAYDKNIKLGGMIEVPAAALAADEFARQLDFLSIGTNDLIQYTLAADRLDNNVNYLYQPSHPAVLKLIHMTIRAGEVAGIPVAMCGEMAGDSRYTRLLLGLGLREFSMQPTALPEVKSIVQSSDVSQLRSSVENILQQSSAVHVDALIEQLNNGLL